MILVYTNSIERCMRLATGIDGVVLKTKQKVRTENYNEFRGQLEQELRAEGYIHTFFQGEVCTLIYSEGSPFALKEIADYDSAYAALANRPIPYIPENMEFRCTDSSFAERMPTYQKLFADATIIINAASDDTEGELSFMQLAPLIPRTKQVFRARPLSMTKSAIVESFNALEILSPRVAFQEACYLHEELDWLVSRNASNAISRHNFEGVAIPAGRLESVILTFLANNTERRVHPKEIALTLRSKEGKGEISATISLPAGKCHKSAEEIISDCQKAKVAIVEKTDYAHFEIPIRLLNITNILSRAAAEDIGLNASQTSAALVWLYDNGYITWPTPSSDLPWTIKPMLTNCISTLSQSDTFRNHVRPADTDDFLDWDYTEPPFGHIGILVTDRLIPEDAPHDCRMLYHAIAESNIATLKMRKVLDRANIYLRCNGYTLRHIETTQVYANKGTITKEPPHWQEGAEFEVVDAVVRAVTTKEYTEEALLDDIASISEEGFVFSLQKIPGAIENLISWGHLTRSGAYLKLTERGRLAYKYLEKTSLADSSAILFWDRRLLALAQGRTGAAEFEKDMKSYIKDLCEELIAKAQEIVALGGRDINSLMCPICKEPILFPADAACTCSSPDCGFHIPSTVFGYRMSKLDIAELLTNGRTKLITEFVSKKGTYAARIILDEKGNLVRSFASPHKCPRCQSQMGEYAWGVKCGNKECGYSLNTTICEHRLTDEELALILTGKTTAPIPMINSAKKAFVAMLSLKEDLSLNFTFPDKKQKQGGAQK